MDKPRLAYLPQPTLHIVGSCSPVLQCGVSYSFCREEVIKVMLLLPLAGLGLRRCMHVKSPLQMLLKFVRAKGGWKVISIGCFFSSSVGTKH